MHGFLEKVIQFLPKLSDEQVKRVLLEVSNEHQLLLSLIDSLPTGIIIVSKDWKIRQLNKFAERTVFAIFVCPHEGRQNNKVARIQFDHVVTDSEIKVAF